MKMSTAAQTLAQTLDLRLARHTGAGELRIDSCRHSCAPDTVSACESTDEHTILNEAPF